MATNAQNVSVGKPNIGGAIWSAKLGTALPTDTTTELDTSVWKSMGYVSDSGLVNSPNTTSTDIKAWGGDTVLSLITDKNDQFKYTLIEATNIDVLKSVYGEDNVSGELSTGIAIKVNNAELEEHVFVIDMVLRNGTAKRIVIPCARVSALGDITYADSSAIGYETTLTCTPDEDGYTHYEYIKAKGGVSAQKGLNEIKNKKWIYN